MVMNIIIVRMVNIGWKPYRLKEERRVNRLLIVFSKVGFRFSNFEMLVL